MAFPNETMEKYFYDFLLGLTFPHMLDDESESAQWREAMTLLSGTWQLIKLKKSKCALS